VCSSDLPPGPGGSKPAPKVPTNAAKPKPKPPPKDDSSDEGPDKISYRSMALMMFPTSGRCGFNRIQWPASEPVPIARDDLKRLLLIERSVRLSDEAQTKFSAAGMNGAELAKVTEWTQTRALEEFGLESNDRNLLLLRSALSFYPNDAELQAIPFYSRYNRCQQGNLDVGSSVPDTPLIAIDGSETSLQQHYISRCAELGLQPDVPMVLVGGSYS